MRSNLRELGTLPLWRTCKRPWGRMYLLCRTPWCWVKVIRVDPGQRTSRQYHLRRSELHISLDRWRWCYVPRLRTHWMEAGLYLELAWGRPDETDIVRTYDIYGRR